MYGLTWEHGYSLCESVFNFEERSSNYANLVMNADGCPPTAHHMAIVESYPNTFDAIEGNYI